MLHFAIVDQVLKCNVFPLHEFVCKKLTFIKKKCKCIVKMDNKYINK